MEAGSLGPVRGYRGRGLCQGVPTNTPCVIALCDGEEVLIKQQHASLWLMWFLKIWCLARVGKSTFITPARTHIHTHTLFFWSRNSQGPCPGMECHDLALFLITNHGPCKHPQVSQERCELHSPGRFPPGARSHDGHWGDHSGSE